MKAVEITQAEYEGLLPRYAERTLFHGAEWAGVLRRVFGVGTRYIGFYQDDVACGVLPLFTRRMFGISVGGAPLPQTGTPRILPLIRAGMERPAFRALSDWAPAHGSSHLQVWWPVEGAEPARCTSLELRDNLEVDLNAELATVWKPFKAKARNIRRALAAGVRIHWNERAPMLEEYARLLDSTYGAQGIRPNFPPQLYRDIFATFSGRHLRIVTATLAGRVIAALWLLYDDRRCYFWDGASLQEHRQLNANDVLHWEAMKWARSRGAGVYDLVGGTESGRGGQRAGIGRYKKSIGGRPVDYALAYFQKPWARPLFKGYRALLSYRDRVRSHKG